MPVAPMAGVPPRSTLEAVSSKFEHFPTPYVIAPGLDQRNFYQEGGQIILACIVALMMLIFFFLLGSFSGSQAYF